MFYHEDDQIGALTNPNGETVIHICIWYMGKGWSTRWAPEERFQQPTVGDDQPGSQTRTTHLFRPVKIEDMFWDLKNQLGLIKLMDKRQIYMEKMLAVCLLTFTIPLACSWVKRAALTWMANLSQNINRRPTRNVSPVPLCSSEVKKTIIPVYSYYSKEMAVPCRQETSIFLAAFGTFQILVSRMSDLSPSIR